MKLLRLGGLPPPVPEWYPDQPPGEIPLLAVRGGGESWRTIIPFGRSCLIPELIRGGGQVASASSFGRSAESPRE